MLAAVPRIPYRLLPDNCEQCSCYLFILTVVGYFLAVFVAAPERLITMDLFVGNVGASLAA